jgi:penicillin-binding protein 1C
LSWLRQRLPQRARLERCGVTAGKCVLVLFLICGFAWYLLPPPLSLTPLPLSPQVKDRAGKLLHIGLSSDEKYRLATPLNNISPELIRATLLQEDQHFWRHCGVNPWSLLRAAGHVCVGHLGRGGASTITMQLARLRYHLHTKSASGKLGQIFRALQLERHHTKKQILEAYLNCAPYGGNVEGIGAASLLYFGKAPARLTQQEAALLSVLPQSPTRRTPRNGSPNRALSAAASRLFARMQAGMEEEPELPMGEPLLKRRSEFTAPHFVRRVLTRRTDTGEITTTLDRSLQSLLERRVASFLQSHRAQGIANAAALLVDTRSMEVLAQVGSADFRSEAIAGQVDGTRSRRSPGSTLKPFIYALALDQGLIHPLSVLADAPRRFGAYAPENFDGDFAGPIKATDALARSRNVPAVALAQQLAHPTLHEFLKRGGVELPRGEEYYGLSLPLGGGEVTMEELVALYAALANGGKLRPLHRTLPHTPATGGSRLLSPEAAFLTLEMLGHVPRPDLGSPAGEEGVAWKTGTSMGFRDAWAVAVFDGYVLAVWVGNFDGRRNAALVGRTCAGPLLFQMIDAMRAQRLGHSPVRRLAPQTGANLRQVSFCAASGALPTTACAHTVFGWFIPGISPIAPCEVHREILIDDETGLRHSQDDGTRSFHRQVYEFWPSDLQALFAQAGLPRRRPPPFAPGCSVECAARTGRAPEIVSPGSGRTYAVREGDPVALQARSEGDATRLYWFAGRAFLGSSAPREPLSWRPSPGLYQVTVLDDHGRTSSSKVTIQAM